MDLLKLWCCRDGAVDVLDVICDRLTVVLENVAWEPLREAVVLL